MTRIGFLHRVDSERANGRYGQVVEVPLLGESFWERVGHDYVSLVGE
jgi:hypothetical protein